MSDFVILCPLPSVLCPESCYLNPESYFLCLLSSSTVMSATAEKPAPHPNTLPYPVSFVQCPVSCVLNPVKCVLNPESCFFCLVSSSPVCCSREASPHPIFLSCVLRLVSCVLNPVTGILFLVPFVLILCDVCCSREASPPIPLPFSSRLQLPIFFIIRVHLPASSPVIDSKEVLTIDAA